MGEGEDLVPINIHCGKLLEWLVSRRHCGAEWQKDVHSIREKITAALMDMPEHPDIFRLLSDGSCINYFHCSAIVTILRETEAETKNIFGRYSSQRMKDWQEIVGLYEKDGVFLAESASLLQRLVSYEIPGLKRQIGKCGTSQEECLRKEAEYAKLAKEADRSFRAECAAMKIGGQAIKKELLGVAQDVPQFLDEVAKRAKLLTEAAEYYRHFRELTSSVSPDKGKCLPVTATLLSDKGNITYYEYVNGKPPLEVRMPDHHLNVLSLSESQDESKDDEGIDFGDMDSGSIDFGDEGIDFDDASPAAAITLEVSGDVITQADDGVARGNDAFTLLEHPDTQADWLVEMLQLEAFLTTRLCAIRSPHPAEYLIAQYIDRSKWLDLSEKEVSSMLELVKGIHGSMVDSNMRHLFKIRSSER